MTVLATETTAQMLWRRLRSPAAWSETADLFAILTVASLPWSTSLTAIFNAVFLVCMVPFLDVRAFLQSLTRPICAAPLRCSCSRWWERCGRTRLGARASMRSVPP